MNTPSSVIVCPKCGAENAADAPNCVECRINLKVDLVHAEKQESLEPYQGVANDTSGEKGGGILKQIESSSILQILLGFLVWLTCRIIIQVVQMGTINQLTFGLTLRMILVDIVFGIIPGAIGGVIGWLVGSKWNREKRVLITILGAIFATFYDISKLLFVWPILWLIGGVILWLVGHTWTQKKRVLVAILGPVIAILILLIPFFFMILVMYLSGVT